MFLSILEFTMSSNLQDFLEPQDVLKDFVEVKDLKRKHSNFEHRNSFNELKSWQLILHALVISTFTDMVL